MNVYLHYKLKTIGDSWIDSHFIYGFPKFFWCTCSYVWWCSEFDLSHHSDDIFQGFTKGFMWWVIILHLRSKLNRTASMVITRSQYQTLKKEIFYSPEICRNVLNIFGVGLNSPKLLYKINRYTWSCIVLLEIVLFFCHCILW